MPTNSTRQAQSDRTHSLPRGLVWPLLFVVAGLAAVAIDAPVAQWVKQGKYPSELYRLLSLSEAFSHGYGVAIILVVACTLDPAAAVALPRMAVAAYGGGLMANVAKLLLARTRPGVADLETGAWQSFGPWLPLLGSDRNIQSFPSAHMATAAGLAIALGWLYPRGRWVFAALAVLAAGQRVIANAHFVSDACWGAALGTATGLAATSSRPVWIYLDQLGRWSAGIKPTGQATRPRGDNDVARKPD